MNESKIVGIDRSALLSAAAVAAVAGAIYILRPWIFHTDDAFISYQFAEQIRLGFGYTYHPALQPIQGGSSPLHVLVLSVLGRIFGGHIDEIGYFLSALGSGLLAAVLARLAHDSQGPDQGSLPLVSSLAMLSFIIPVGLACGLEVVWAAALLILTAEAVNSGRIRTAMAAASIMILIRPDWALYLAPLSLLAALFHGPKTIFRWAAPLILLCLYFLTSHWYFGEAVPFTWIAKAYVPKEVSGTLSWSTFLRHYWGVGLTLLLYATVIFSGYLKYSASAPSNRRRIATYSILLLTSLIYTFILKLKGAPNQAWYFVAPVTMSAALAAVSLRTATKRLIYLFVPAAVACHVAAFYSSVREASSKVNKLGHHDRREVIGRWISSTNSNASNSTLVAFEVGKVAYYSGAKVYDILGLISREGVEGMKTRDPGLLVRTTNPDYVIGCDCPNYFPMSFIATSGFRDRYTIVHAVDDYRVWQRNSSAPRKNE